MTAPAGSLKRRADRLIHHPTVEYALLALITASVVALGVELLVPVPAVSHAAAVAGDLVLPVFWLELTLRFWVARSKRRFFSRYWVDILAVLPLARPLRVFRVVRVLRLVRAGVLISRRMGAFRGRIGSSTNDVLALAVATAILVVSAAGVLEATEGPVNPAFATFRDALWFSVFSMVGGEPIGAETYTTAGRWATLGLMLGGMTLFGMFVGTVSAGMVARLSSGMGGHRMDLDELTHHVIVFGWNEAGGAVLRELFGPLAPVDRAVVLVTETPELPDGVPLTDIRGEHFYHHVGDYVRKDVLEAVGVPSAATTILLTDTLVPRSSADRDARTVAAALTIERMAPDVYTVAELTNPQHTELLRMAGVEEIVVGDWFAGMIIGSATRNRGLVAVLDDVLTARRGNSFHSVVAPATWGGMSVGDAARKLGEDHRAVLIAVDGEVNPERAREIRAGDALVVLSEREPRLR